MTDKRLQNLDHLNKQLDKSKKDHITFDDLVGKKATKESACE